ncbi:GNAT family N-acetyltransferase [Flavobacteriales bacterium]|nr:GNAT family N-acetyltransferase [Flavobacteriales bacterium]
MNAAWNRAFPNCISDAAGRRCNTTLKWGLRALITPPWAQDIGHDLDVTALKELISGTPPPLVVLDLPAGMEPPHGLPPHSWTVPRHTRQSALNSENDPVDSWPATRRKQLSRATREGMLTKQCHDLSLLVELHQSARVRKGLNSDESALSPLLEALLQEPDTHAWTVHTAQGEVLAGGVFHGAGDGRCVYGFGGQFRTTSPGTSSRATVLLIGTAMRHAAQNGAHTFDFGGSMDAGVDRFYSEFGAPAIVKHRLVRVSRWWQPLLRWRRPDLFPV